MTTLLPDETSCKTDLGSMLYKDRKIYGFHAEIVGIKEPSSFLFGHVDYDLVITATPHNPLNNEARTWNLTSRFKELNRLYVQLSTIHRQLYLKDTFPNFVEAKMFGTATPETIAERRRAIDAMLNFVLKNDVLCKTRVFQAFIETAKEKSVEDAEKSAVNASDPPTNDASTSVPSTDVADPSSKAEKEVENSEEKGAKKDSLNP